MRKESARRCVRPGVITVAPVEGQFRIEETLRFITPMFGGGVRLNTFSPHQKEHDPITPVRGASLRGQLREWWRRTCAVDLDLATMRAREKVLWGWASTQDEPARGLVSVSVSASGLKAETVQVYQGNRPVDGFGAPLAYGAFPLQPAQKANGQPAGTLTLWIGDFKVALELLPLAASATYRDAAGKAWGIESASRLADTLWNEVERAWLAFVTFGGLGGRTRRGFGAVRVARGGLETPAMVAAKLGWTERVALHPEKFGKAGNALRHGLGRLRDFRQGVGVGRNKADPESKSPAGRSRWPEPDAIRLLRRTYLVAGDKNHAPKSMPRTFPRAAFGMPIIFKFKDDNVRGAVSQDPAKATLTPSGVDRLASPIIICALSEGDMFVSAVLLLPELRCARSVGQILESLELYGDGRTNVVSNLSGSVSTEHVEDISPVRQFKDPREGRHPVHGAFLKFFTH